MISPPAPHAPFTPAERHKNEFSDLKAPRTPNFDTIAERLGNLILNPEIIKCIFFL